MQHTQQTQGSTNGTSTVVAVRQKAATHTHTHTHTAPETTLRKRAAYFCFRSTAFEHLVQALEARELQDRAIRREGLRRQQRPPSPIVEAGAWMAAGHSRLHGPGQRVKEHANVVQIPGAP